MKTSMDLCINKGLWFLLCFKSQWNRNSCVTANLNSHFWIFMLREYVLLIFEFYVNPILNGGKGGKKVPYQFSPVTSSNVGINPTTFWFLILTLLPHWRKNLRPYLVPVPDNWPWIKTNPQEKWFFWSNPCKIKVMITSLIAKDLL